MTNTSPQNAFGFPGIEPYWSPASKEGVGTAYLASNRVWFTLWKGILTEVYYPTADRPQIRDLQYLITDGKSFLHHEQRDLKHKTERMEPALGYRITTHEKEGRYTIEKQVITDPHLPCVLQHTRLIGEEYFLSQLKLYVLCTPHLGGSGWGNNAYVGEVLGQRILLAQKADQWLALAVTCPFSRLSCGYAGRSDAWTDLVDGYQMDYQFDQALDGHVTLTGEIEVAHYQEFTLGLAFGENRHSAITSLLQALSIPFAEQSKRFCQQWKIADQARNSELESHTGDSGKLYRSSYSIIIAHEAKTYQGGLIASLSIPWGESKLAEDGVGGYHLVWSRDMIQTALGLLAAGNQETPLRALIYLAASQRADGSFPQNFWIDGQPFWTGIQLDEMAFPILFARRLYRENILWDFDPMPMVMRTIKYLIVQGPVTEQDRWEEQSGYSPSTLAVCISASICAACFAREQGDQTTAQFLEWYGDWLRSHLVDWTVTNKGTLLEDVKRHFVRINPVKPGEVAEAGAVDQAMVSLSNQPPDTSAYLAKEIIDAGFLELVRCGVLAPDDPLIVDSVRVVDATLKVETPFGSCWRRYNYDGYGQRDDGSAYIEWGKGRAWPLLTAERDLYEMALGRDVRPYLQALELFAMDTGLLPEQVWDAPDLPEADLYLGQPIGSARPLLWAHAKYINLLRSAHDGKVYDQIPEVAQRYLNGNQMPNPPEMWSFQYPVQTIKPGQTLRVLTLAPFQLRWSADNWQTVEETDCTATAIALYFVDVAIAPTQQPQIHFTFFWKTSQSWENQDFSVKVQ